MSLPARSPAVLALLAASLIVPGCASSPPPAMVMEGDQEITLKAWAMPVGLLDSAPVEVRARCTLHNDKGTWTVTTQAGVTVQRSAVPLEVECAADGYKTKTLVLECRSPYETKSKVDSLMLAANILVLPAAIAVAPISPVLAGQAALQGAAAAGSLHGQSKPGIPCTYGAVIVVDMDR